MCDQPQPQGPDREFRYYNVAAFHPRTGRLHNTRCWLPVLELTVADTLVANPALQDWILLIVRNMFRWNPNTVPISWDEVVITDLPIPPNPNVPQQPGAW